MPCQKEGKRNNYALILFIALRDRKIPETNAVLLYIYQV